MFALAPLSAHFIGGFGRIVDVKGSALLSDVSDAASLIQAEPDIVEHMNTDHPDAVALLASEVAACPEAAWRMTGIDPAGADFLHCTRPARLDFPNRIRTPAEARAELVAATRHARKRLAERS
jgi:putative heme iron utilization protein